MSAKLAGAPKGMRVEDRPRQDGFATFFAEAEPRLRRALVARLGAERGREATAEALAWAFEHWAEVEPMANGVGYLYRVGISRTRARKPVEPERVAAAAGSAGRQPGDDVDPELWAAVSALTDNQRVAVVLVRRAGPVERDLRQRRRRRHRGDHRGAGHRVLHGPLLSSATWPTATRTAGELLAAEGVAVARTAVLGRSCRP